MICSKTIKKNFKTIALLVIIINLFVIFQQKSLGATNDDDIHKELHQCIVSNDKFCVEQALRVGASPDAQTPDKTTLLMMAIKDYYDEDIISLLIENSANLNKKNQYGTTALQLAMEKQDEFVLIIIDETGKLDWQRISSVSKQHNNSPVLIKHGANFIMYGLKDKRCQITNITKSDAISALNELGFVKDKPIIMKKNDLKLSKNILDVLKDGYTQRDYNIIVSKLLDKGADSGVEQLRLFYNLRLFVDKYNGRSDKFKNIFEKEEGHCAGLTKIWLYSKWVSKNNQGKYTNKWFFNIRKAIAEWDGKSSLESNTIQNFNEFLSLVTFFQNSRYGDLDIPQTDFENLLVKSPLPLLTGNIKPDKEYTIASTVTVEKLKKLLDEIIHDDKLIAINVLEPIAHHVALYKNGRNYYYYDPNVSDGEIVTESTEEVAKRIFQSYNFNQVDFPAIGFAIYDFNDLNFPCLATDQILLTSSNLLSFYEGNNDAKLFITYHDQEDILNELNPFANERVLFPVAFIGCINSAEYFLHKNVSVNAVLEKNKESPLMIALEQKHFELAKKFIKENADPNLQSADGETALMKALFSEHSDIAMELIKIGADPNLQRVTDHVTALIVAIQKGYIKVVKMLLSKGANPDQTIKSDNDETPLMKALFLKHPDIAIELIKGGANPNLQRATDGVTALMIAVLDGHKDIVKMLIDKGANPDQTMKNDNDETPLMKALLSKRLDVAIELIKGGANPNLQRATDGVTALMIAVLEGHKDIVKMLIDKGANPDQTMKNNNDETPLMKALFLKRPDIAIELIKGGANKNLQRATDGVTALMIAAELGYIDIVKKLIANGANLDLLYKDKTNNSNKKNNSTALILALIAGHTDIAIELLNSGAKTDLQRKDGASALMIAAQEGHIDVVKKLLEKCADFNLTATINGVPTTALMLAFRRNHFAIVTLLRNAVRC